MGKRSLLLFAFALLLGAAPLSAQRWQGRFAYAGPDSRAGAFGHRFGGFGGFRGGHCGYGGFAASVFAAPFYGNGFGYGYPGFGNPYFGNYPAYPYAAFSPQPQYVNVILEPHHDWRYWSPPSRVLVMPVINRIEVSAPSAPAPSVPPARPEAWVPEADPRVIGMGLPQWSQNTVEPLGDVARRHRQMIAASPARPAVLVARSQ